MEKIGFDRLFIRFNIKTTKGNELCMPSLQKIGGDLEN